MANSHPRPASNPMAMTEPGWITRRQYWILLLILGAGVWARFFNQDWDEGTGQHPDERHVLMCTWRLDWPKSLTEYFDEAHSPLNPRNRDAHFFAYGTLPSTLLRAVVKLGDIKRPEQMTAAARVLSALADTAVIGLIFALGRLLYRRAGVVLLAAGFYAFAVLPIQHAHFFVVDPFANMFVAVALVFLARAWRDGRWRDYAATGMALGLAVSCKISVLTFGVPVLVVALVGAMRDERGRRAGLIGAALRLACFGLVLVATIRVALPDAFVGFWPWQLAPRWLANMQEVVNISTGVIDIVFTRQFYGRIPWVWPWWNMAAWGLGLALGLAAWAGWAVAAWRTVRWRETVHVVPVIWIAVVFVHLGHTYQSTLRYFLPIYGPLCLMAAWGLCQLAEKPLKADRGRALIGRVGIVVVSLFTMGWAVAFLSLYTQPYTRAEASRWIYKNIPVGSTLACEHWDDWLPLPIGPDQNPGLYHQIELPLYVADGPEKRGDLLAKLNAAEYIVLASQKLRDSIPRMPHRYPFTISYYQGLEDGSLGFDRVAEFSRSMNFFGFRISTRSAEEAFSVYDHPPVVVYKKAPRYDPEALVQRFNAIPLDGVTDTREPEKPQPTPAKFHRSAPKVGPPESAILFSPERARAVEKEGTWSEIFSRDSFGARHPIVAWVLGLIALQATGWMLLGPLLKSLPDRGSALARPFFLLLVSWILWLLASSGLGSNTRTMFWLIFGAFALVGGMLTWKARNDWQAWWRQERSAAFRVEGFFWFGFFFFLLVRAGNPDLWHPFWGGEKPMEMTYLYGVLKSQSFPPLNPWYAGGVINYYYFGFVLCGNLIKAFGVLPEVGFNLCLATFFGIGCAMALSVGRALRPAGSWLVAWAAAAFVMWFGNLFQIRFVWGKLVSLGAADHELSFPVVSDVIRAMHGLIKWLQGTPLQTYPADFYWVSARAILGEAVAPVTEFPFWSFVYGDLHPHLISLSYTLGVVALLAAWIRTASTKLRVALALLLGLTLGFFWPTNAWDWPTYGALTGLVIFIHFWQRDRSNFSGFCRALLKSVGVFLITLAVGYAAFLPFHRTYVAGYGSFELWQGERTSLTDYFFIYGFFLFVLGTALVAAKARGELSFLRGGRLWGRVVLRLFMRRPGQSPLRLARVGCRRPASIAGGLFSFLLILLGLIAVAHGRLPALLLMGILLSLFALWSRRRDPARAFPVLLTLIAFTLSLLVEFVVLVGDVGRMNTVFKFYYQVWVCFALASALALPGLLAAARSWTRRSRVAWRTAFVVLILTALLYPLTGVPAKIRDRFGPTPLTLDGLRFAETAQYDFQGRSFPLAPDLHAIRWLQDHVAGSPTTLEVNTGAQLYSWGARFATHTGLPTVLGWNWHQRQQQAGLAKDYVEERMNDILTLYRSVDLEQCRALLSHYGVKLVIIGELERIYGTPEGIEKFSRMGLSKIYDAEGVEIYEVPAER